MVRFALTLEYDGGPFVGWQAQDNGLSVQGLLEEAVFRFAGERVRAAAAGRTDAGVHALAMVAQIDLETEHPAETVRDALNHHLKPHPVAVLAASQKPDDWHARFSCTGRHYLYRFVSRRAPLALERGRVWRRPRPLDVAAMQAAAQCLVGRHDFTTFRAAQCQADSPVKTVDYVDVAKVGDEVHLTCGARSFLHNQVRSFAGSLEEVGAGRWSVDDVKRALAARDRAACGQVAPADGLYFLRADY